MLAKVSPVQVKLSHFIAQSSFSREFCGAMIISFALHLFILFAVKFGFPDLGKIKTPAPQSLQVVLVNNKSQTKPQNPDALAQFNSDGGGNTDKDEHVKTPLPAVHQVTQLELDELNKRVEQMEQEQRRLITQLRSETKITQPEPTVQAKPTPEVADTDDLVARSLQMAKLEAQIAKQYNGYEKIPRKKTIGSRTTEYRFAQYVEDWRSKVERFGNLNYPPQIRNQKIYGKVVLSVIINLDGSIADVSVEERYGKPNPLLAAAAISIVKRAAPYPALPAEIRKDTDLLEIVRTWTFAPSDRLESNFD